MDDKKAVSKWRRAIELAYTPGDYRRRGREWDRWHPPGPVHDAALFGLFLVAGTAYFAISLF